MNLGIIVAFHWDHPNEKRQDPCRLHLPWPPINCRNNGRLRLLRMFVPVATAATKTRATIKRTGQPRHTILSRVLPLASLVTLVWQTVSPMTAFCVVSVILNGTNVTFSSGLANIINFEPPNTCSTSQKKHIVRTSAENAMRAKRGWRKSIKDGVEAIVGANNELGVSSTTDRATTPRVPPQCVG